MIEESVLADGAVNLPSGHVLLALSPLVVLVVGVVGFALVDLARRPSVAYSPKPLWAIVVALVALPLARSSISSSDVTLPVPVRARGLAAIPPRATTRRTQRASPPGPGRLERHPGRGEVHQGRDRRRPRIAAALRCWSKPSR